MDDRLTERDLLIRFRDAKNYKTKCEEHLEIASKELANAEGALIEALMSQDKNSTADFEGIGRAVLGKPSLFASCKVDNQPSLLSFLQSEGRMDLVRNTVNPKSLSAFVSERIENGKPVPDFISYFLKPKIKMA